jgi:hypothetical protein
MASNSKGSYRTTPQNMMRAFDKLPPSARSALAEAAFNYAPQPILTNWRRGTPGMKTGEQIAQRVREWDAQQIAKDRKRVWGISDAATVAH